jgi:hypothetical protein
MQKEYQDGDKNHGGNMDRTRIDRLKELFHAGMEYWGREDPVPAWIRDEAKGFSEEEKAQAFREVEEEAVRGSGGV